MAILTPEELRGMAANARDWPEALDEIVESHEQLRTERDELFASLESLVRVLQQLQVNR